MVKGNKKEDKAKAAPEKQPSQTKSKTKDISKQTRAKSPPAKAEQQPRSKSKP